MSKDYWLLWQGQLVSQLGTQAFQVLALFWLAKHTGSSGMSALFLAASLLPPVFLGPALARWSTRFAPRTVLAGCDFLAAGLALPVLLAFLLEAPTSVVVGMLLLSNTLLATVHALMMPTLHASVPRLVSAEKLSSANGWMMTTQQVASAAGQGLGGLAYALLGPLGLCAGNMLGFFVSGALTTRMQAKTVTQAEVREGPAPRAWQMLRQQPALLKITVVSAVFNVLYAPWLVLLPFHLAPTGRLDPTTLGLILACYGVGNIVGNLLLRKLPLASPRALPAALLFQGVMLAMLGLVTTTFTIGTVLFLMGMGIGLVNVQIMTKIQTAVSATDRAPAIAVMRSSVHLATPAGYGAVALAQQVLGFAPGTVFMTCGGILLMSLLVLIPWMLKHK